MNIGINDLTWNKFKIASFRSFNNFILTYIFYTQCILKIVHLFIHSCSFIHFLFDLFIFMLIYSFSCWFVHFHVHLFIFIFMFIYSFSCSFIHFHAHLFIFMFLSTTIFRKKFIFHSNHKAIISWNCYLLIFMFIYSFNLSIFC